MREGTTRRRRSALDYTAYHEAGHAVAAYLLHVPIRSVTIVPSEDGDDLGGCQLAASGRHTTPESGRTRANLSSSCAWMERRLRRYIQSLLAGLVAERRVRGRYNWIGAEGDLDQAELLLDALVDRPDERRLEAARLYAATQTLLREPAAWQAVTALAGALLAERTLRARQVRCLIREALDERAG